MRISLGACAAYGLILLAAGCGRSAAQGTIVFSGVVHGSRGIFSVDPDGRHLRRLTGGGSQLAWSGAAKRLAFVRDDGVWVISTSGGDLRRVVAGPVYEYSWSPDGRRLVYRGDDFDLYVSSLAGAVHRLTGDGRDPVWSPDGEWIAFLTSVAHVVDQVEEEYVAIVHPDGTGRQRLQLGLATGVAWSPDGRRLAYTAPADTADGVSSSLYTMLRDGTDVRVLVPRAEFDLHGGEWSPDGGRIALTDGTGTSVVDRTGAHLRRISALVDGSWSPDGGWLVLHDATRVEVIRRGGTGARTVATVDAVDSLAWLPGR